MAPSWFYAWGSGHATWGHWHLSRPSRAPGAQTGCRPHGRELGAVRPLPRSTHHSPPVRSPQGAWPLPVIHSSVPSHVCPRSSDPHASLSPLFSQPDTIQTLPLPLLLLDNTVIRGRVTNFPRIYRLETLSHSSHGPRIREQFWNSSSSDPLLRLGSGLRLRLWSPEGWTSPRVLLPRRSPCTACGRRPQVLTTQTPPRGLLGQPHSLATGPRGQSGGQGEARGGLDAIQDCPGGHVPHSAH